VPVVKRSTLLCGTFFVYFLPFATFFSPTPTHSLPLTHTAHTHTALPLTQLLTHHSPHYSHCCECDSTLLSPMSMSILRVCSFRRAVTSLSNGITSSSRPSSNRARGAVSVSARRWLGTTQPLPEGEDNRGSPCLPIQRVCVVGSGPSGFYTTKYLLENADKDARSVDIRVDMMEKLPTPFGLVRYGVAPDHPEVKIVADQFSEVRL
jgi:hypothetical protein